MLAANYPSNDINLGPLPKFNYEAVQRGISVTRGDAGFGNYLPSVTRQDYLKGTVANAPAVSQKLYFYAPLVYKEHHDKVNAALDAYILKPANSQAIRTALDCDSGFDIRYCACLYYDEYTPPYLHSFKQLIGDGTCGSNNNIDPDDAAYPIQFTYKLPGTTQKTTDYIIYLEKN